MTHDAAETMSKPSWLTGVVDEARPSRLGPNGWFGTDAKVYEWVRSTAGALKKVAVAKGFDSPHVFVRFYRVEDGDSVAFDVEKSVDIVLPKDEHAPIEDTRVGSINIHAVPEIAHIMFTTSVDGSDNEELFKDDVDQWVVFDNVYAPTATEAFHLTSLLVHELGYTASWGVSEVDRPFRVLD